MRGTRFIGILLSVGVALPQVVACGSDNHAKIEQETDGAVGGKTAGKGAGGAKVKDGSGGATSMPDGSVSAGGTDGGLGTTSTGGDGTTGGATGTGGATSTKPGITLNPSVVKAAFAGTVQFTANVQGVSDKSVTWTVQEGTDGGTISSSGLYVAPQRSGVFHVVVTSTAMGSLNATATVTVSAPAGTPPVLSETQWTDVSPPGLNYATGGFNGAASYGLTDVSFSPANPRVLYVSVDQLGLYKSTDAGTTWKRLGDPTNKGTTTTKYYLDNAGLAVDPADSEHLYATEGVRGGQMGFWRSTDGGNTWVRPTGWNPPTQDVTTLVVEPNNFKHVLVGSHSPWPNMGGAGILETLDGGDTWIKHDPPPAWGPGTIAIGMLYSPSVGIGDPNTWLVGTDSALWKTTDAGKNWHQLSNAGTSHGGAQFYFSKTGYIYMGGTPYPRRSKDVGDSWEDLKNVPYAPYYSVYGDGDFLYTQISFTGTNARDPQPYLYSQESDGLAWKQFNDQKFIDGPNMLKFDAANGIMYSANWKAGLWALKVKPAQ